MTGKKKNCDNGSETPKSAGEPEELKDNEHLDNNEADISLDDTGEETLSDKAGKILMLSKRRGFFWNSNEIYGGSAGFYDYGPLGTRLECNLVDSWRDIFVVQEGFAEVSTPVITPEAVFSASGHLQEFTDLMVECEACAEPFRADLLLTEHHPNPDNLSESEINDMIKDLDIKCPNCGGSLTRAYPFNLMFKTNIGPGSKKIGYLRPETAQGMFVNFHLLYRFFREKVPFGAVQIGRAFRNEISPRQGMIRLREFKMAELEYFVDPSDKTHPQFDKMKDIKIPMIPASAQQAETESSPEILNLADALDKKIILNETLAYFIGLTYKYLSSIGMPDDSMRFRQHQEHEMAHYAEDCWDAEVLTSYGWIECVGIADRSCYDVERHNEFSGHSLAITIHYEEPVMRKLEKVIPKKDVMGKKYKGLALKICSALEKLEPAAIKDGQSAVKLEIDGKEYEIDRDGFDIKTVEEKEFGKKIIPHVIEPSFGLDRIIFALIENAYYERENGYRVLRLKPGVAPIDVGVFPLMAKPELVELTKKCVNELKSRVLHTYYDESGSIGRRYARMDETGTPYCVTVDYESLDDNKVTIRERDSTEQVRVEILHLPQIINDLMDEQISFEELQNLHP